MHELCAVTTVALIGGEIRTEASVGLTIVRNDVKIRTACFGNLRASHAMRACNFNVITDVLSCTSSSGSGTVDAGAAIRRGIRFGRVVVASRITRNAGRSASIVGNLRLPDRRTGGWREGNASNALAVVVRIRLVPRGTSGHIHAWNTLVTAGANVGLINLITSVTPWCRTGEARLTDLIRCWDVLLISRIADLLSAVQTTCTIVVIVEILPIWT